MTDQEANDLVLAAIAAISGQSVETLMRAFTEIVGDCPDVRDATDAEIQQLVGMAGTRLGLAPAVSADEADSHRAALAALVETVTVTHCALDAWTQLLRHTPEYVPSVNREPVVMPLLPTAQTEMWKTLMDLDNTGQPWVLVGGQMTILHCLENGIAAPRTTDDGDVVVGVWTRRDALSQASSFLRQRDFAEVKTSDGYGYRFTRGETAIDLLLPEGLERQNIYPATASGRPGLTIEGGNQALARAERLPITVEAVLGYVRRPTLLGAIVAKAHAYTTDSRDADRHAQDLVILATIALANPRAVLQPARPGDGKPVRRALRSLPTTHAAWRISSDASGAAALLARLAGSE